MSCYTGPAKVALCVFDGHGIDTTHFKDMRELAEYLLIESNAIAPSPYYTEDVIKGLEHIIKKAIKRLGELRIELAEEVAEEQQDMKQKEGPEQTP